MFDTDVVTKGGSVILWYEPVAHTYNATVAKDGSAKSISDTDLGILFKQLHSAAGDRLAVLAIRKFANGMGNSLRALLVARRQFLQSHKAEFKKLRAAAKATKKHDSQKATKKVKKSKK